MSEDHSSIEAAADAAAEDGNFLRQHIEAYIGSGGTQGHIVNLKPFGGPERSPTLLLRTIGKKSGKARFVPLVYGYYGCEWTLVGTNAGATKDPAWIVNLREMPEVRFQVSTYAFRAERRFLEGDERENVFAYMKTNFPGIAEYELRTAGREIPIVSLKPIEDIPLFRLDEL